MKSVEPDLGWNKRRLFLLLGVLVILIALILVYLIKTEPKVKGLHTYVPPAQDSFDKKSSQVSQALDNKIQDIRGEVMGLDVSEVATSSPQIQKVINDIKSIQDLPSSKAKEACQKICSGL